MLVSASSAAPMAKRRHVERQVQLAGARRQGRRLRPRLAAEQRFDGGGPPRLGGHDHSPPRAIAHRHVAVIRAPVRVEDAPANQSASIERTSHTLERERVTHIAAREPCEVLARPARARAPSHGSTAEPIFEDSLHEAAFPAGDEPVVGRTDAGWVFDESHWISLRRSWVGVMRLGRNKAREHRARA
jgi:hypothetical protein